MNIWLKMCSGLEYFSFLRPLNELKIAQIFASLDKFEQFAGHFTSCNANFKIHKEKGRTSGVGVSQMCFCLFDSGTFCESALNCWNLRAKSGGSGGFVAVCMKNYWDYAILSHLSAWVRRRKVKWLFIC